MDISKNNIVDLLYLTNPNLKIKYNKKQNVISLEDIKFYRKRILLDTKEYLRGKKINPCLDSCFENYASKLIEHYKFIDKKEIIEEEYKSMEKNEKKPKKPKKMLLVEENKIMMKNIEKEKKTIKDFLPIVVKEKKKKKMILPKKKEIDLKNPKYRNKKKKI
jgi:hypothetical protein